MLLRYSMLVLSIVTFTIAVPIDEEHKSKRNVFEIRQTTSKKSSPLNSKKYFGVGANSKLLSSNSRYANIVKTQFNAITPENEMKWDAIEKSSGRFTFEGADQIVNLGTQNKMIIRGHNIVWHQQAPNFLKSLGATQLRAALQSHTEAVMKRYKGKLYALDVINEPFTDSGGELRNSFWLQKLGPNYLAIALQIARKVDPSVKLYINDFSIEGQNSKSDALFQMAKKLKSQNLLDGIGFESHLIVGQVPKTMQVNLQRFASLGLEVAITELDVRMKLPPSQTDLQQQAKDYKQVIDICQNVKACVGVTMWNVGYSDSWVPSTFSGFGAATLFNEQYQATAALNAISKAAKP